MTFRKKLSFLPIVSLLSCAPSLLFEDTLPEFNASSDKALVVYLRTLNMPRITVTSSLMPGGASISHVNVDKEGVESEIYVDGKYVGGLKTECLTTFEIGEGEHIISSCERFCGRMKIKASKNKVYFIEEMPIQMGPLGTRLNIQFITKEEANQKISGRTFRFTKPNPEKRKKDMDADDAKEELEDWNDWAKENPEDANAELQYQGY